MTDPITSKIEEATEKFNRNAEYAENSLQDKEEHARCYKLANYTKDIEFQRGRVKGLCEASDHNHEGIIQQDGKIMATPCEAIQQDMRKEARKIHRKFQDTCHE